MKCAVKRKRCALGQLLSGKKVNEAATVSLQMPPGDLFHHSRTKRGRVYGSHTVVLATSTAAANSSNLCSGQQTPSTNGFHRPLVQPWPNLTKLPQPFPHNYQAQKAQLHHFGVETIFAHARHLKERPAMFRKGHLHICSPCNPKAEPGSRQELAAVPNDTGMCFACQERMAQDVACAQCKTLKFRRRVA